MAMERRVLYTCDCPRYHGYNVESTTAVGWLSAIVDTDIDMNQVITLKLVSALSEKEKDDHGRVFLMEMECFDRWAQDILFPIKPAEEAPASPKPETCDTCKHPKE